MSEPWTKVFRGRCRSSNCPTRCDFFIPLGGEGPEKYKCAVCLDYFSLHMGDDDGQSSSMPPSGTVNPTGSQLLEQPVRPLVPAPAGIFSFAQSVSGPSTSGPQFLVPNHATGISAGAAPGFRASTLGIRPSAPFVANHHLVTPKRGRWATPAGGVSGGKRQRDSSVQSSSLHQQGPLVVASPRGIPIFIEAFEVYMFTRVNGNKVPRTNVISCNYDTWKDIGLIKQISLPDTMSDDDVDILIRASFAVLGSQPWKIQGFTENRRCMDLADLQLQPGWTLAQQIYGNLWPPVDNPDRPRLKRLFLAPKDEDIFDLGGDDEHPPKHQRVATRPPKGTPVERRLDFTSSDTRSHSPAKPNSGLGRQTAGTEVPLPNLGRELDLADSPATYPEDFLPEFCRFPAVDILNVNDFSADEFPAVFLQKARTRANITQHTVTIRIDETNPAASLIQWMKSANPMQLLHTPRIRTETTEVPADESAIDLGAVFRCTTSILWDHYRTRESAGTGKLFVGEEWLLPTAASFIPDIEEMKIIGRFLAWCIYHEGAFPQYLEPYILRILMKQPLDLNWVFETGSSIGKLCAYLLYLDEKTPNTFVTASATTEVPDLATWLEDANVELKHISTWTYRKLAEAIATHELIGKRRSALQAISEGFDENYFATDAVSYGMCGALQERLYNSIKSFDELVPYIQPPTFPQDQLFTVIIYDWLVEYLQQCDRDKIGKFVRFVTGMDRLYRSSAKIHIKFEPASAEDGRNPHTHSCSNELVLCSAYGVGEKAEFLRRLDSAVVYGYLGFGRP